MKKIHELTSKNMESPRGQRARRFADTVQYIMRDFLPSDRKVRYRIEEYLFELGWEGNCEVINVRPEWDELTKAQIEQAMLESHPMLVKRDTPGIAALEALLNSEDDRKVTINPDGTITEQK